MVAEDGDPWLKHAGVEFINQCKKTKSEGGDTAYYTCLQTGLKKVTGQLSGPCKELGEEGLWDEARCQRLISYIFIKEFDEVLRANRPILQKLMDRKVLNFLSNPILAIILLLLYVLDIVFWTDPGNWYRIPKFGFIVGALILISWFLDDQYRFLGIIVAVLICVGGIIRNHVLVLLKNKKKKEKYPKRRWKRTW
jgi:hypothetical protein